MAERATVARPYAKAAFAHARDKNVLDAWSGWLGTARAIVSSDEFEAFQNSPGVRKQQLKELVAHVCGDALDANARAFLDLLAENGRIGYLPEIATHFDELTAEHQNVADVEVVSAAELNAAQRERLAGALRARLRRDVRLNCTVDPALIGGAVVRTGDLLIDGSIANKLQRLDVELTTG
ncbi:MAG: F0F1 ATP synthase subunit delta [Gammaproteobacteria bacterium]|nr:F0F1 ATP synthase subunit delta [Gammaproteobacteria bacterium]MDH4310028.1 F0F1 ATP synthase subunit delta [Gammaproteobacteria bacterium]MDH5273865.1 F0F1 ATP synthase subunit delta [Gammaproteobacteria bacterium]